WARSPPGCCIRPRCCISYAAFCSKKKTPELHPLAARVPDRGGRGAGGVRVAAVRCCGARVLRDTGEDHDPRVVLLRGTGTAGGQPCEDDRGCVGTDEPRDAPDVDSIADVPLLRPFPGCHDSV